jgi:hypothetical protein
MFCGTISCAFHCARGARCNARVRAAGRAIYAVCCVNRRALQTERDADSVASRPFLRKNEGVSVATVVKSVPKEDRPPRQGSAKPRVPLASELLPLVRSAVTQRCSNTALPCAPSPSFAWCRCARRGVPSR